MHFIFNIKKKKKKISKKKPQASIALLMNGKITIHNPRKKSRRFVCSHNQRKFQQTTLD